MEKTEITRYRAQGHAGNLAYRIPCQHLCRPRGAAKGTPLEFIRFADPSGQTGAPWLCRRRSRAKAAIIPPSSQRRTISRRIAAAIFRNGRVALSGIWLPVFMSIIRLQRGLRRIEGVYRGRNGGVSCHAYFSGIFEGRPLDASDYFAGTLALPRLSKAVCR